MRHSQSLRGFGVFVTHQHHFRAFVRVEVPNDIRAPIPVTNNADPDHLFTSGLRFAFVYVEENERSTLLVRGYGGQS